MGGWRRWLAVIGPWWLVVNVISIPVYLSVLGGNPDYLLGGMIGQSLIGFPLGPAVADEWSVLPVVFAMMWPAYVVLAYKMWARDWRFAAGIMPTALAVLATIVSAWASTNVGLAIEGHSPGFVPAISALPSYATLAVPLLVVGMLANLLSWPLARRQPRPVT